MIAINLSKRQQYIALSILAFIAGIGFQILFPVSNFIILTVINFPVVLLILYLYVRFNKTAYYIDKAILLLIFLTCMYLLPYNFPNISALIKIIYFALMSFGLYSMLLSLNIFSVSENFTEDLPLLQPARLLVYLSIISLSYISSIIIYKISIFPNISMLNFLVKSILFSGYYYVLFRSLHWFFVEEKIGEVREKKIERYNVISRFIILILSQTAIILMFFPYESYAAGIIVAACVYANLSIAQGYLHHTLVSKLLIEFFAVISAALFVAYFIS